MARPEKRKIFYRKKTIAVFAGTTQVNRRKTTKGETNEEGESGGSFL